MFRRLLILAFAPLFIACTAESAAVDAFEEDGIRVLDVERTGPGSFQVYGLRNGTPCEAEFTRFGIHSQKRLRCGGSIERRCLDEDAEGCWSAGVRMYSRNRRLALEYVVRSCEHGGRCNVLPSEIGYEESLRLGTIGCAQGQPMACVTLALAADEAGRPALRERALDDAVRYLGLEGTRRVLAGTGHALVSDGFSARLCTVDPTLDCPTQPTAAKVSGPRG